MPYANQVPKPVLSEDERKRMHALLRVMRWRQNPHIWAHERLGVPIETLDWAKSDPTKYNLHNWDGTKNPIVAISKLLGESKNVACESGTGTGKTFFAAIVLLWFLDVFPKTAKNPGGFVITVAPKEEQLKLNLWKEVGRLWSKFQLIRPNAKLMNLRIRMDPNDDAKDAWGAIGYPVGLSADEEVATRAQGFHNPDMLIILEETPGIPMPIAEAFLNTSVAPHNLLLALGNPENEFDTLHELVGIPDFESVRISALDHPNVVLKKSDFIAGAVSKESIESRLARFKGDKNHPLYLSRVRGVCPEMSESSLFRPEAIRSAREHMPAPIEHRTLLKANGVSGTWDIYQEVDRQYRNRYLIFADVAGDKGDGDWHAAVVLDRMTRAVVATIRMRGPREEYVRYLLEMAERYTVTYPPGLVLTWEGLDEDGDPDIDYPDPADPRNFRSYPVLAWETNNVGSLHLIPEFRDYPNLYYRRTIDSDTHRPRNTLGWATTQRSRKDMIEFVGEWGLEVIANPSLMPDQNLVAEAVTMVWVVKKKATGSGRYEAKAGHHDDLIMALGGALVIDRMLPHYTKLPAIHESMIHHERQRLLDKYRNRRNGEARKNFFGTKLVDPRGMPLTP